MNEQTANHLDKILGNTKTKNTPGPWIYGVRKDKSIWLSLGDATKGPHHQGDFFGTVEDVKLIVSAPKLLDALSNLVSECVKQEVKLGPLIADALAAIAKAEGRR